MNKHILINISRFIVLIIVQVFLLNNIQISGYINPYLYVYFILLLPFETPKWLLLTSAFFLGLGVDIFSDTMGMHAAASVFMAFCRPSILKIVSSHKEYVPGIYPTIRDLGFRWFFIYSLFLISIHHFIYFYIEVFKFSEFLQTFYRAIISVFFTLFLSIILQYLFYKQKK